MIALAEPLCNDLHGSLCPHNAPSHTWPGAFLAVTGVLVPLDLRALLTGTEAASYCGVTVQAVVNWRTRGYRLPSGTRAHLRPAADAHGRELRDSRGRRLYRLADVLKAEAATSRHAGRAA